MRQRYPSRAGGLAAYAEVKIGKAEPFEADSNVYRLTKAGDVNEVISRGKRLKITS